jgi:geranylgeranyl reductase family protein
MTTPKVPKVPNVFDAIVAGAGPAGSTAAYALSRANATVALIDKAVFPREKACGGGLQARVFRHLPVDVTPVIRNSMNGVCFSYKFGDRYERRHHEPIVYGVLRREFDHHLLQQAVGQGSALFEGTAVTGFEQEGRNRVRVSTSAGVLYGRVLIGADGANGVVRRALNAETAFFNQAGLSFEIWREEILEENFDNRVIRIDWGTLPSGYAWIFPKTESVNIGVGAPVAIGRDLRRYLHEFLSRERILKADPVDVESLNVTGHKLPSFTERTRLREGNVLVVGDAAGLIEPFTGDGISHGIHSGRLAAEAVRRWLCGDEQALSEYPGMVWREIVPELVSSRKLMTFFNTFPGLVHKASKLDDRAWEIFCRVLKGEDSFDAFRRKALGPLYFLWKPIDRFTLAYEARKLVRWRTGTVPRGAVRAALGRVLKRG